MPVNILVGDVRAKLRELPSQHFDCVVTSPPYWGLRDYGVAGQIGLEPTLGEHLAVMVDVFREVRRVLKQRGTLWLNYGDCYAAQPNGRAAADVVGDDRTFRDKPFSTVGPILQADARGPQRVGAKEQYRPDSGTTIRPGGFLKPKDLCMIPNRLAIALQDDGWFVRSEIIWHKPNPMPESVYDRPTSAHEKIWLLTRSEDYFYNHEAIREPVTGGAHRRAAARGTDTGVGWGHQDDVAGDPRGRGRIKATGPNSRVNIDRVPRSRKPGVSPKSAEESNRFVKAKASFHASTTDLVESRNARNVWTIAPKAFREAHFATFPPALAERCIRAGVPLKACSFCGHALPAPTCQGACRITEAHPGRVLDPFGGAGTVGLVAQQLGLDATLIELNPDYAAISQRRVPGSLIVDQALGSAA
jgi:DNA modification methylase